MSWSATYSWEGYDDAVFPLNQGLLDCHRLVHAELSNPGVEKLGTSHAVLELLHGWKRRLWREKREPGRLASPSGPSPSFLQWASQRFQKMGFHLSAP